METKVLTQEELTQLRNLRDQQNNILEGLGSIEYRITLLENNKASLKSQIAELEKANATLGAQLTEKYGNGSLNLETGEITVE
jgi:septal ring factor EnvC (AmiA/AmiB activator)